MIRAKWPKEKNGKSKVDLELWLLETRSGLAWGRNKSRLTPNESSICTKLRLLVMTRFFACQGVTCGPKPLKIGCCAAGLSGLFRSCCFRVDLLEHFLGPPQGLFNVRANILAANHFLELCLMYQLGRLLTGSAENQCAS
jgi:hypothetical protein